LFIDTAAWNLLTSLFYVVLLEDIILNCLSLSVVLMCMRKYSLAYHGVSNSWNSLSSDIVNANSISLFKQVRICSLYPLCASRDIVQFCFVGQVSVSLGPEFCLNKWIWEKLANKKREWWRNYRAVGHRKSTMSGTAGNSNATSRGWRAHSRWRLGALSSGRAVGWLRGFWWYRQLLSRRVWRDASSRCLWHDFRQFVVAVTAIQGATLQTVISPLFTIIQP